MKKKIEQQEKAICLREQGATLSEIAEQLGVAQSSVSLWVKKVIMTEEGKKEYQKKLDIGKAHTKEKLIELNKARPKNKMRRYPSPQKRCGGRTRCIKRNQCLMCGEACYGKYCARSCELQFKQNIMFQKVERGEVSSPATIKRHLLRIKEHKCEICGITEWLGRPINLVQDHIDGNSNNNVLANLRLICNNCDSYLPTYKSKNRGSGRHWRRKKTEEYPSGEGGGLENR